MSVSEDGCGIGTTKSSLGQALLERNAINSKINDLITRVINNAITVVDGDGIPESTPENSPQLLNLIEILENRHDLVSRAIIAANYNTVITYDSKEYKIIEIIELISTLEKRVKRIKELIRVCEEGTSKTGKRSFYDDNNKEKKVPTLNLSYLRDKIDKMCSQKNKLQVLLQEANWSTKIEY